MRYTSRYACRWNEYESSAVPSFSLRHVKFCEVSIPGDCFYRAIPTQPVLKDQGNPQIGSRISKDGESATVPGVRTRDTGAAPCGTKPDDASAEPDSDWPNNAD